MQIVLSGEYLHEMSLYFWGTSNEYPEDNMFPWRNEKKIDFSVDKGALSSHKIYKYFVIVLHLFLHLTQ